MLEELAEGTRFLATVPLATGLLLAVILAAAAEREAVVAPLLRFLVVPREVCFDLFALNSALTSWSFRIEWTPVSPILRAIAERSLTVWDRKSATVINGFTLFSVRANNNYVVSVMPCIVREPVKR